LSAAMNRPSVTTFFNKSRDYPADWLVRRICRDAASASLL
jgi:hypothetical protein